MQNYKEINGNDYVKESRTTINETMRSIQSMNSGTVFPTTNLFEGMKCYRTDLKKTYTLTDVENNTWVEDDIASKLSTARKINITGNATGTAAFDGSGDVSINVSVSQAAHADKATQDTNGRAFTDTNAYMHISALADSTDFNNVKTTGIYTCTQDSYTNRPVGSLGVLRVYWLRDNVKQEYVPDNKYEVYERYFTDGTWNAWSKVNAANADTATKLATARAISLTGNASGSATFDGSGNISINTNVSMADTVDGYHESSFLRYRGDAAANGEDTLWSQIGIKRYEGKLPKGVSGTYDYGGVVSLPAGAGARLDIWYNHTCSTNGDGLWYRSGYSDNKQAWARLLDSVNYTKYVPTKTGGGASGTWPISISGNADTVDGYHASDIINSITAANTGGIVAASLTKNGYVKFANGLILQWGTRTEPKVDDWVWVTTTFPIAFASACFSVTCCDELTSTYDGDVESLVRNIKTNSVDIRYRSDHLGRNLRWLALGV